MWKLLYILVAPFLVCLVVFQLHTSVYVWKNGVYPSWLLQGEHRQGWIGTFSSSLRTVQVFMSKAKVHQFPGSSCWGSYWSWAFPNFSFLSSSIFWSQWLFQWQAIQAEEWKCCLLISSFLDYRSPAFQSFGDTDLHVLLLRIGSGLSLALSACQALEKGRRQPKSALFNLNLKVFCSERGSSG